MFSRYYPSPFDPDANPYFMDSKVYFSIKHARERALSEKAISDLLKEINTAINGFRVDRSGSKVNSALFIRIVTTVCDKKLSELSSPFVLAFTLNEITDYGLYGIAAPLSRCKFVSEIHLGSNQITKEGAMVLLNVLEDNYTILNITLEENKISSKILDQINALLERNRRINAEIEQDKQRKDFYVELLLVTMSHNLPQALNKILLEYCSEIDAGVSPFISKTPYNYHYVLAEAHMLFQLLNTLQKTTSIDAEEMQSIPLAQKLRSLQCQLNPSLPPLNCIDIKSQRPIVVFTDPLKKKDSETDVSALNISENEHFSQDVTQNPNICGNCIIL